MYAGRDFDYASQYESEVLGLSYEGLLETGEILTDSDWSIALVSGSDASPASRLVGSASIMSSSTSVQRVSAPQPGCVYTLSCLASTSRGRQLLLWAYLRSELRPLFFPFPTPTPPPGLPAMATILPNGRQQFFYPDGRPLADGLVYTYEVGGSTPKTTWQDKAGSIQNTNPIVLDSQGTAAIWGAGDYRQVVTEPDGTQIWDANTLAPPTKATTPQAQAGTDDETFMTPLKTAQAIAAQVSASVYLRIDGTNAMTGPLRAADGTVGSPGIRFNSSTSTGLYRPSPDTIGVSVAGTAASLWSSAGFTQYTGQIVYNDTGVAAPTPLAGTKVQIVGSGATRLWMSGLGTGFAQVMLSRADGTAAAPAAVASGGTIGTVGATGYGATAYASGARGAFEYSAAETWTDTAQGTDFRIRVTPTGSTTLTTRMQISSNGDTGLSTVPAYRLHVYRDTQTDAYMQRGGGANVTMPVTAPSLDGLLVSTYSSDTDFRAIADYYLNGATRGATNGIFRYFPRTDAGFGPVLQLEHDRLIFTNISGAISGAMAPYIGGGLNIFSSGTAISTINIGANSNIVQGRFNGTAAAPTAVASGDRLAGFGFRGFNGGGYVNNAVFVVEVDGAVSSGITPTRYMWLGSDTAGVLAERMRLTSSGQLGLNSTTPNKSVVNRALTVNSSLAGDTAAFELSSGETLRSALLSNSSLTALRTATATPLNLGYNGSDVVQIINTGMGVGGAVTPAATLDVNGTVAFRTGSVALANGLNSNIATPAFAHVRITGPTGAFSVGGLTGGVDGRIVRLYNTVSQTMTIVNEDASSTAGNRITTLTGANIVLRVTARSYVSLRYDATESRWIVESIN